MDGAVWHPSAPLGFNSVGDLWSRGYDRPALDAMYVVTEQCVYQCTESPQLIYNDRGSGAHLDGMRAMTPAHTTCNPFLPTGSIWSLGVAQLGTRSGDNYGLHRANGNYNSVDQQWGWNQCLKPECVKTIQLKDFTVAQITYDTSVIDPSKSKGTAFHHQSLINNSPGTISSTVTGTKSTTKVGPKCLLANCQLHMASLSPQAVTMTFTDTVTNTVTISEKISIKAGLPDVAEVTEVCCLFLHHAP